MKNTHFSELKAIEEIGNRYSQYDNELSKIVPFQRKNLISVDGLSLLDDIEFFLSQPGFGKDVEEKLFKIIQEFSLNYLRSQRGRND